MVSGGSGHHPGRHRIAVRARPRRWDERLLGAPRHWYEAAGEGYPPPREIAAISISDAPSTRPPLRLQRSPHLLPWAPQTTSMIYSASPTSQPKVNGRRLVRVMTVVRHLSRFMGPMGPQLSGRLPTGGRLPRGASLGCS